jgi:uncharacterized protein (TIGR02266 family)
MHRLADAYQYYYSVDVSLGGMFLKTRNPFPVGTRIGLDFALPGKPDRVTVEGEVVRTINASPDDPNQAPGMGIVFTEIDSASLVNLTAFFNDG